MNLDQITGPDLLSRSRSRSAAIPGSTSCAITSTARTTPAVAMAMIRRIECNVTEARPRSRPPRGALNDERRPEGRLLKCRGLVAPLGGAYGRGRRRRARGRRRRVLELLLGTEQRVEHLGAELLAGGERESGAEADDQQLAAEAAALLGAPLRRLVQRDGRVAECLERRRAGPSGASCPRAAPWSGPCRWSDARTRSCTTRSPAARSRAARRPRSGAGCTDSPWRCRRLRGLKWTAALIFFRRDAIDLPRVRGLWSARIRNRRHTNRATWSDLPAAGRRDRRRFAAGARPSRRVRGRACGRAGAGARPRAPRPIVETNRNSRSWRRCSGISSMSCSLSAGAITQRIPLRWAASAFSLSPPIGSTWPVSVISPVIATSARTSRPVSSDASAVPSRPRRSGRPWGSRPAGTWMWMSWVGEPVVGEVRQQLGGVAPARRTAPPAPTPASRRRAGR